MASPSICNEVSIGREVILLLMQDQTPYAEFQGQSIKHLWILCDQCNLLSHPAFLKEFAQISNFLWKGLSFKCIDQIADFQKKYHAQIELEKQYLTDVFPYRLTDYKIFDVSVMHDPLLIEGQLNFFVFNISTGIPYRVICPFPYTSLSTQVHYQTLPIKG